MKGILPSLIILALTFGCSDNDGCLRANVIGPEACTDYTLIQVFDLPIGRSIDYYDQTHYKNVIKVPGGYPAGPIYLNLRDYNKDTDQILDLRIACYNDFATLPFEVPRYVITSHSTTGCR